MMAAYGQRTLIAHLTDTHLGQAGAEQQLGQVIAQLLARPDEELGRLVVVITGDLTDDSAPSQWQALARALAPLTGLAPVLLLLGNHDCGKMGITYDETRAARARDWVAKLSPAPSWESAGVQVWELAEGLRLVGLDSSRGNEDDWFPPLARGELGAEQLASLELALQDPARTVLALHHHPRWSEPMHLLEDAGALTHLVSRRPQVKLVLFGHQHVEASWGRPPARVWLSGGKTTEPDAQGALRWRMIDLAGGQLLTRWVSAPAAPG